MGKKKRKLDFATLCIGVLMLGVAGGIWYFHSLKMRDLRFAQGKIVHVERFRRKRPGKSDISSYETEIRYTDEKGQKRVGVIYSYVGKEYDSIALSYHPETGALYKATLWGRWGLPLLFIGAFLFLALGFFVGFLLELYDFFYGSGEPPQKRRKR